jgi:hypothetical protein
VARIAILDPTAPPPRVDPDPGPDLGPLSGRRVGFRSDLTWRSFLWVADEWSQAVAAAGAATDAWCAGDGNRTGEAGVRVRVELEGFALRVDAAVVGLGN